MLGVMSLSLVALPLYAQADDELTITTDSDYDWDYEWDTNYDQTEDLEELGDLLGIGGLVFGGIVAVIALIFGIAMYVYSGLALMTIAKKLNQENSWYAWIPILNMVLLLKMGDQNPWLILLVLIPGVGALIVSILSIIALMNICEKRGYDKMLGLLALVPLANIVLMGILAWGKNKKV